MQEPKKKQMFFLFIALLLIALFVFIANFNSIIRAFSGKDDSGCELEKDFTVSREKSQIISAYLETEETFFKKDIAEFEELSHLQKYIDHLDWVIRRPSDYSEKAGGNLVPDRKDLMPSNLSRMSDILRDKESFFSSDDSNRRYSLEFHSFSRFLSLYTNYLLNNAEYEKAMKYMRKHLIYALIYSYGQDNHPDYFSVSGGMWSFEFLLNDFVGLIREKGDDLSGNDKDAIIEMIGFYLDNRVTEKDFLSCFADDPDAFSQKDMHSSKRRVIYNLYSFLNLKGKDISDYHEIFIEKIRDYRSGSISLEELDIERMNIYNLEYFQNDGESYSHIISLLKRFLDQDSRINIIISYLEGDMMEDPYKKDGNIRSVKNARGTVYYSVGPDGNDDYGTGDDISYLLP
ncbi:MAG: hypothetical protein ACOCWO_02115 [Candidatus Muiribacteriaceae bacterium]